MSRVPGAVRRDMSGQSDTRPLLILAAGGTGGHVFPAQALAEEMLARGWRVMLWTDSRGSRFTGSFPRQAEIQKVASATFSRGNLAARLSAPLKMAAGIAASWMRLRRLRPAAIAGFGGYPAFPPLAAACISKVPRLIHEQNGVLGRANRLLSTRVDVVVCGAVSTGLPPDVHALTAGNPVRSDVLAFAEAPYSWPAAEPVQLLVMGGSQGACVMDHAVPAAVGRLPDAVRSRIRISQQVRPCHTGAVARYYSEAGVDCEIAEFFEDVPRRMSEAHVIIARAGASTVAEIAVIGRPAILIPFAAAANDHQSANAEGLVAAGAAVAVSERDASPDRLMREMLDLFENPARAEAMALAASRAAAPRAAAKFADIVEDLVRGA